MSGQDLRQGGKSASARGLVSERGKRKTSDAEGGFVFLGAIVRTSDLREQAVKAR